MKKWLKKKEINVIGEGQTSCAIKAFLIPDLIAFGVCERDGTTAPRRG